MERENNYLDPNPVLFTETLDGSQMSEPFIRLRTRQIDSLTIDDAKFLSVDDIVVGNDDTPILVRCTAEDGRIHLFTYEPTFGSPVQHHVIETS